MLAVTVASGVQRPPTTPSARRHRRRTRSELDQTVTASQVLGDQATRRRGPLTGDIVARVTDQPGLDAPRLWNQLCSVGMNSAQDDDYLTVAEIAARLKINPQTVRNWISRDELRAVRVGARRVRIPAR
ncbi:MAG: helix-turn-helix domain-containing protein [Solirubrobacteraceae bacterium]